MKALLFTLCVAAAQTLCAQDLGTVLTNGNLSTVGLDIILDNGSGTGAVMSTTQTHIYSGGFNHVGMRTISGTPQLFIGNPASGTTGYIENPQLNDVHLTMGAYSGEIVANHTPTPISITLGARTWYAAPDQMMLWYAGIVQGVLSHSSDDKGMHLQLKGGSSSFYTDIQSVTTTGYRKQWFDDDSGAIAINHTIPVAIPVIAVTSVLVPHGMSFTPNNVVPVPMNVLSATSGYYISAITPGTFTISFAAPVSGLIYFKCQVYK